MATLSREEADKLVNSLRIKNGGTKYSVPKNADQDVLDLVESVRSLREQLGPSNTLLATELYTKSTRFVYELIQNAEDNSYSTARAAGLDPFLRFSIYRDKIVIDSNEDGFSKADVNAICQVRNSTKAGVRGFVGEKGIGFKSVFTVASMVHVQSEPFAFYFKYAGEKDGMGMITPFNGNHDRLPGDVRTRFVLTLKDSMEFSHLVKEFTTLPDTLLLFLTTLKKLQIFINDQGKTSETSYEYKYESSNRTALLMKYSSEEGLMDYRFFVRKKMVQDLPDEEARKDINDAEVVLAFPVDEGEHPVIKQQYVCAYLPLRKIGFPFQIQSDFVTQASREDVLQTPRNNALLVGAAEVFVEAVIGFCEHPLLQYLWPKYLPSSTIVDPFWAQIRGEITSRLSQMSVLRTWKGGKLKCIEQLKYLLPRYLDKDGEPLFKDLADEKYLSNKYAEEEVSTLRTIGLENMSVSELWNRVKADLNRSSSKMKSRKTSAAWHSRAAEMILGLATRHQDIKVVKAFDMLPLQDGSWTSINDGLVHYHEIDGVDIPLDLGLRILAPKAAAHPARKKLFDAVGVAHCDFEDVKKLIISKYAKWNNVNLASSVSHMHFLFQHCLLKDEPVHKTMFLFDEDIQPIYRTRVALGRSEMVVDDVYFDDIGAYNAAALRLSEAESNESNIHILNSAYMDYKDKTSLVHDLSWKDWLQTYAGVLASPRLVKRKNPQHLSKLFTWIIEERREYFLGVLRTHWKTYKEQMNPEIEEQLRRVKVKCINGEDVDLEDTFAPLPQLLQIEESLELKGRMRFLAFPSGFAKESLLGWLFLETFGVGVSIDTAFYVAALDAITWNCIMVPSNERTAILTIYAALEKRTKVDDYNTVREAFINMEAIHVRQNPKDNAPAYDWESPQRCVWKGPDFLTTHSVLAEDEDYRSNDKCKRLFTSVLQIPDADWSHTLDQIAYEKEGVGSGNHSNMEANLSRMYHALLLDVKEETNWNTISERFEKESLVYVRSGEWRSPSECIWSDHTYIPGKFPLAKQYVRLKTFFVRKLGVQSPTLESQIQELHVLCSGKSGQSKCSQVINLMKEINRFEPTRDAVSVILGDKIIPAKNEQDHEVLLRPKDTFVIVDRQEYGTMFAGKVAIFGIPLPELRSVQTLLSALGLAGRYISGLVNETSSAKKAVRDADLTRDFRRRAYALMRCARHFGSPHAESGNNELVHRLKRVQVYQSSKIVKTVNLELDGQILASQNTSGNLHLKNGKRGMKIYMPKDEKDQEICIHAKLPERLAKHLSMNKEAISTIKSALTAKYLALDDILLADGVPEIPELEQLIKVELEDEHESDHDVAEERANEPTHTRSNSNLTAQATASFTSYATPYSAPSLFTQSRATTPELQTPRTSLGRPSLSPGLLFPRTISESNDYVNEYKKLLGRVIDASQRASFPSKTAFQASAVLGTAAIDYDTIFGVRSRDALAHDMRIGAAGELFAFEMLCRFTDQSCGIEHWKSTIRHRVSVHEKYRDLAPWTGRETADIVFEDRASTLTAKLISYGYLTWDWRHKTPTYFLEVKTTTGACDTRFFMSKAQVRRMKDMRLPPPNNPNPNPNTDTETPEIYIILRVYNLNNSDINMRILVDPATLEQEGTLLVEAENYTVSQRDVVPSNGNNGGGGGSGSRVSQWAAMASAAVGEGGDQIESPI